MRVWVKSIGAFLPALVVSAFLLLLYIPDAKYYFFSPDQGFQIAVADQILSGNHPWMDVQGGGYGPLVFYSSALGQWLFRGVIAGEVFITFGGYLVGYLALYVAFVFVTHRHWLAMVLLLASLFLFPEYYKYYVVLGPALLVCGLYAFLCTKWKYRIWFLAICTAINGLYRFDFGAYSVVPCGLAFFLVHRKPREFALAFTKFSGMIIVCASPWLLFLLIRGELFTALNNVYVALSNAGSGLALPNPVFDTSQGIFAQHNAFTCLFYAYPLIPITTGALLYIYGKKLDNGRRAWLLCVVIFSIFIYSHALHRTSLTYLLQVSPVFLVLLGFLLTLPFEKTSVEARPVRLFARVFMIFAVFILLMQIPLYHFYLRASFGEKYEMVRYNWRQYFQSREAFVEMMGQQLPQDGHRYWMVDSVKFVRAKTTPDQYVLFYPYYPALYYWSERRYGAGYSHLFPAKKGYEEKQKSFIETMKKQDLPFIVDDPAFSFDDDPSRNAHVFAPLVMEHVAENYEPVVEFGTAVVYQKRKMEK